MGSAEEYCELRIKSRNVNTWYKLHLINHSDKHKKMPFVIGYLINIDAFKSAQKNCQMKIYGLTPYRAEFS